MKLGKFNTQCLYWWQKLLININKLSTIGSMCVLIFGNRSLLLHTYISIMVPVSSHTLHKENFTTVHELCSTGEDPCAMCTQGLLVLTLVQMTSINTNLWAGSLDGD